MKVHFITSKLSLEKDIDSIRSIVDIIKSSKHTLARDWISDAYDTHVKTGKTADDWSLIYNESLGAIAGADVIVADATYENFAVGYQVAVAVQQKKPVLLLRHSIADKNAFVTGVEDGWVRHEEYDGDSIGSIMEKFLSDNDITTKDMRFNFFIDRSIYNYLRWAALKTGKTKAEVLRELVKNEIEKKD